MQLTSSAAATGKPFSFSFRSAVFVDGVVFGGQQLAPHVQRDANESHIERNRCIRGWKRPFRQPYLDGIAFCGPRSYDTRNCYW